VPDVALVPFAEMLAAAAARGQAVGAFTAYNLEQAIGILTAAHSCERSVILLVGERSFTDAGGDLLLAAFVTAADRSAVEACVELDHVSDLATIEAALEVGVGAVMADGSSFALDENIAFTRAAVDAAARHGASVECELAGIAGDEDVAAAVAASALTDPAAAALFAERSGGACLAVSIGNVHGAYRERPRLDWTRLEAIRKAVPIPLSLHGASGLSDDDLRRAIQRGITKVNVNTELREAYLTRTEEELSRIRDGARILDLNRAQIRAVAEAVAEKFAALGKSHRGEAPPPSTSQAA
jgi:ketose-bisphosphate aldolase